MAKYKKVLSDAFLDDKKNVGENDALKLIADAEFAMKEIATEKADDSNLNDAKLICKDLNAGYNAATKYEKAKIEFLLEKVEEARFLKVLASTQKKASTE